ncbi:MAG: hypothetical protein R2729_18110 [Bryobacteraceae bacterium]
MGLHKLSIAAGALVLTAMCYAADITGKWTAMVPGRNGEQETTFTLKQDGESLTGSVTTQRGERSISDGKVSGETVTFSVEGQRGKQTYTGTVSGGEIKFKRETGQGQAREFTAKKAQS